MTCLITFSGLSKQGKGNAVQAQRVLRLPDFLTTVQYGGRLSALRTGRLYPQEYSWYSFSLGAESTPEGNRIQ